MVIAVALLLTLHWDVLANKHDRSTCCRYNVTGCDALADSGETSMAVALWQNMCTRLMTTLNIVQYDIERHTFINLFICMLQINGIFWCLFCASQLVSSCKLERNLLPPKKLFGNQSEAFIKRRLGDLETYLQTIMYFLVNRLPPPLAAFLDFNKYVCIATLL